MIDIFAFPSMAAKMTTGGKNCYTAIITIVCDEI